MAEPLGSPAARFNRLLTPVPADGRVPSAVPPLAVLAVLAASVAIGIAYGDSVLRAMPFVGD